jgi:Leishmanolysin
MPKRLPRNLVAALVLCVSGASAQAAFTINLSFAGLTTAQQSYFSSAKSFWEGVITGYQPGIFITGLTINAFGVGIDGVGRVLGSAGPTWGVFDGGFVLPTVGEMQFDTADIDRLIGNGTFTDVVKHEMAHVMGFGTSWGFNGKYVDGSGRFTGANALARYQTEFNQPGATFVPVELGGGAGTIDGHWDEVDNGAGNTGILDTLGRDKRFELMTGWLNAPTYVSQTTIASFQDIGYTVNLSPVPEPETVVLWMLGLPFLVGFAARRRAGATTFPVGQRTLSSKT